MSARAWRNRRDGGLTEHRGADRRAHRRELLTAAACPYWRHVALGAPPASCATGCWTEPACVTSGTEGPSRAERRVLRRYHPGWTSSPPAGSGRG